MAPRESRSSDTPCRCAASSACRRRPPEAAGSRAGGRHVLRRRRAPASGDRIVEGAEYLKHGRYLTTVGGRTVVKQQAIDAARGRRIRWQPSGLVATVDSVRVEDQGPLPGGRRLHVVITLRVVSPGTSGLRVGHVRTATMARVLPTAEL